MPCRGFERTWLKRVEVVPVWSLSCFYVRRGYRKRGVTSALIAAALKAAKRVKAPALEAYPLDGALTPSASGTGYASTFARAGLKRSLAVYRLARLCVTTSRRCSDAPRSPRAETEKAEQANGGRVSPFYCENVSAHATDCEPSLPTLTGASRLVCAFPQMP
jgi:GNAT superfamily N-acetyltransferase